MLKTEDFKRNAEDFKWNAEDFKRNTDDFKLFTQKLWDMDDKNSQQFHKLINVVQYTVAAHEQKV